MRLLVLRVHSRRRLEPSKASSQGGEGRSRALIRQGIRKLRRHPPQTTTTLARGGKADESGGAREGRERLRKRARDEAEGCVDG